MCRCLEDVLFLVHRAEALHHANFVGLLGGRAVAQFDHFDEALRALGVQGEDLINPGRIERGLCASAPSW